MNRDVVPRVPKYANTMASRLKEFTKMNAPMFYGVEVG